MVLTSALFAGTRTLRSKITSPIIIRSNPLFRLHREGPSVGVSEMAYGALVPLFGHCIRISYHHAYFSSILYELGFKTIFCAVLTVNDGGNNNVKGQ